MEHPAIAEAAVVGLPLRTLGEVVAVAVTARPGRDPVPDLELCGFVSGRVDAGSPSCHTTRPARWTRARSGTRSPPDPAAVAARRLVDVTIAPAAPADMSRSGTCAAGRTVCQCALAMTGSAAVVTPWSYWGMSRAFIHG